MPEPKQLTELAFQAFLKARQALTFETTPMHDVVIEQQMLKRAPQFLQCIANANLDEVKKHLEDCPELAVIAQGTVTTVSGHTYHKVSAIQLVYLMDDVEMANLMLPYLKKSPEEMLKKAQDQLAQKIEEVETQRTQFKPYDFTELANAISKDQTLINTGKPSEATEAALRKFKEDFKPADIWQGKSWIKEHLQEGFRVSAENWEPWNVYQLRWYLVNVISHKQTRAEKCFEYECSQGLKELVEQKKPLRRASIIKNYINDLPLTYRGSADSSLLLGRDFLVDIYFGQALGIGPWWRNPGWPLEAGEASRRGVQNLCGAKRSGMEKFKQQLDQLQPVHQGSVAYKQSGCTLV